MATLSLALEMLVTESWIQYEVTSVEIRDATRRFLGKNLPTH